MLELFNTIYAQYCTSNSGLRPYPNITLAQHAGKMVSQYNFDTRQLPLFTALHSLWYYWNPDLNKFVKIVPLCIEDMFSAISLAHWIMEDGYFDAYGRSKTVLLCTECFSMEECQRLQQLLATLPLVFLL